ncbi:hypothetical protein [Streptomyces sp. YGL11-2]|uniref:hypothetical protein n=1 Tax=Streptomyces sp. YGL11-2 TaxID=3414028 RepID=UPI003CEECAED
MTERTTYLDPDPRDWRSRKICVRASRWYATVNLDRDGYVDAAISLGHAPKLPAAYTGAHDRARDASIDRIRYDGYPGGFSWGNGPRYVDLLVQFPHVEAAVEALRVAELDRDYTMLHALADRLALPIDDWLAPGERELVRGVDFGSPPAAFLRFLRGKAKGCGVRLNGRATAGSVWVRPTLSSAERQRREMFPDRSPGWADRWTGYVESGESPIRLWAGGRDQGLSYGAAPVQFRAVETLGSGNCPCGMNLQEPWDGGKEHTAHHAAWAFGIRAPKNLEWRGELVIVTTQPPIAWRKLSPPRNRPSLAARSRAFRRRRLRRRCSRSGSAASAAAAAVRAFRHFREAPFSSAAVFSSSARSSGPTAIPAACWCARDTVESTPTRHKSTCPRLAASAIIVSISVRKVPAATRIWNRP